MKLRNIATILLAASLSLACFLALAGCGSSTAGSESSSAAQEQEQGITDESLAGTWHVIEAGGQETESLADKGLASFFTFDGKGGFVLAVYAADTPLERKGTYEIKDGKVYFSLPAMKASSMSADAIDNAEITVEGETLSTTGLNDKGDVTKAKKITDKEYKALLEKLAAAGPKDLKNGEEVSTDFYTLRIDSIEYLDEVYPSDLSGYYTYYQHQDGYSYLVVRATYTNTGTEYAAPCQASAAVFTVGDSKYDATVEVDWGNRFASTYTVDPKDTKSILVCAAIPDAAKDSGKTKLTWSWPDDVSMMQTYNSYSTSNDVYTVTM